MRQRIQSFFSSLAVALLVLSMTSCVTLATKTMFPEAKSQHGLGQPYSGVRCEPFWAGGIFMVGVAGNPLVLALIPPLLLIDLPLSAVADTLILPVDLAMRSDDKLACNRSGEALH